MVVGSILGVLFVSLVRRVMVEDPDLPFPESVAASEIHKAGRRGAEAAKFLFYNLGLGALIQFLAEIQLFANDKDFHPSRRPARKERGEVGIAAAGLDRRRRHAGVGTHRESRVHRRRLHHRTGTGVPEFRGRRAGLGIPGAAADLFPGPATAKLPAGRFHDGSWIGLINGVWRYIVRPIAVGGMMTGAAYTLVPHAQRAL